MRSKVFTLVELLVVIAIILVLAALLLPALRQAKGKALNANCQAQMRQIGLAMATYADDNDMHLPWVRSDANPSTCQTAPFGSPLSGFAYLQDGGYTGSHRILYCPDAMVTSGWGGVEAGAKYRRARMKDLPTYIASHTDTRVDYALAWWGGSPTVEEFLSGVGFGRAAGGRLTLYWTADDYACFAYYYTKISHSKGLYMNLGRVDGGIETIVNWQAKQPATGGYGYYYPYNDRPDWGFWRYFGTGLGM